MPLPSGHSCRNPDHWRCQCQHCMHTTKRCITTIRTTSLIVVLVMIITFSIVSHHASTAFAFVITPPPQLLSHSMPAVSTRRRTQNVVVVIQPLMAWRLVGKYFQIEEMEDRDACTTEVILNPNATVTTLQTNGPLHMDATGMWKLDKLTGDFIMTLHRTYEAGRDSKISTDVGVFTFTTVRKFIGRLYNIGIKQGISGNIFDVSSDLDNTALMDIDDATPISELRKVGFFEMIDSTLSEDGEITLPGRTRSM